MGKLKVFYTPKQNVTDNQSFSPSAGKPAQVLKRWQSQGLPIEVMSPKALPREGIALAHDPAYVQGILDCEIENGFGNKLESVAKSLPYTTGSMVAAAIYAAIKRKPAVSLSSGFHHAGYELGGGYCTFNGLVIAARYLTVYGLAREVGILDCDMHFGNGSAGIIKRLDITNIAHYTFGGDAITAEKAEDWLKELPSIIKEKFKNCDVVLYQAGADPAIGDPLGNVLTTEQLRRRDKIVFETLKKMDIPVAWNLAGGYQDPISKVLDIHDATIQECIRIYEIGRRKS